MSFSKTSSRDYGFNVVPNDRNRSRLVSGEGVFGEVRTARLEPLVQLDFVYGYHPDTMYQYSFGTGSVAYNSNARLEVSSGASLYGTGYFRSQRWVRYRPGQGLVFRFAGGFSTPTVGVSQTMGAYNGGENGVFFGYDYTDSQKRFGVCRQVGGRRELQKLTVTVGAGGAETVTITLDGTAFPFAVVAGSTAATAQQIAEQTYTYWKAWAIGDDVYFHADAVGDKTNAFTISSTGTADGTFSEVVTGAATTDNWTYQEEWNIDTMLPDETGRKGAGPSGVILDPAKGNVYQIAIAYLGYGGPLYSIRDADTGVWQDVHHEKYANAAGNTAPLWENPAFALGCAVQNVTAAADTTIFMGSMGAFAEGEKRILGPDHGVEVSGTITTATPVISLRNTLSTPSRTNMRELLPLLASAGVDSNKPVKISLVKNGTLTDPLWTAYDVTHSFAHVDTAATAITGGDIISAKSVGKTGDADINLGELEIVLLPGDTLTLVLNPIAATADYAAAISWKEDV